MRIFDPYGIRPVDYKSTYPELGRTQEFESLPGVELIFVWYYANATSPIIDMKENKRVEEAMSRAGFTPSATERKKLLDLKFGEQLEKAIERMSSYIPGARYFGWKALRATYNNYQEILMKSPDEFKRTVGTGKDATTEVDHGAYANVTTKIYSALPDLLNKLEEGFGVTINKSEEEEEGIAMLRDWNLNRQKK